MTIEQYAEHRFIFNFKTSGFMISVDEQNMKKGIEFTEGNICMRNLSIVKFPNFRIREF